MRDSLNVKLRINGIITGDEKNLFQYDKGVYLYDCVYIYYMHVKNIPRYLLSLRLPRWDSLISMGPLWGILTCTLEDRYPWYRLSN